jgi:hypothetical protein
MKIQIQRQNKGIFQAIELAIDDLKEYEVTPFTLSLQLIQAHFRAFNLNKPEEGRLILKGIRFKLEQLRGSSSKMELADILLFEEIQPSINLLFSN